MLRAHRSLMILACVALLCACASGPIETQYWKTLVRPEEWAEIRLAIRRVTPSPVTLCSRDIDSRGHGEITVWTEDNKTYKARKVRGTWYFEDVLLIVH